MLWLNIILGSIFISIWNEKQKTHFQILSTNSKVRTTLHNLQHSKQYHRKVLLSSFHLNGYTSGSKVRTRILFIMVFKPMALFILLQLILNAKCHAIRDAQLIEKVDIKKEQLDEEKRLDEMMEVERRKALNEYEEREKAAHFERLQGAHVLQQQITDREQARLLDEEKKDQETKVYMLLIIEGVRGKSPK